MATATLLPLLLLALLRAAVVQKLPQVKLYLWVEFWGNLLLFFAHDYFGWQSLAYSVLYAIGQLAVFAAFWRIVRQEATTLNLAIFGTFWAGMGYFAFRIIPHSLPNLIVLLEGVFRLSLAMSLGITVPHSMQCKMTYGTLVLLWLGLGAYDLGFVLYPNSWIWLRVASWMPGLLCISGFGWIGFWNWSHQLVKPSNL